MKNFGGLFMTFLLLYGEIFGIIHSVRHHKTNDVIATVLLPPWALWRSIELFWHDDYANVDWNKRMKGDVYTLYRFLSADPKKEQMTEFNEALESFSKRIMAYPKDKIEFLNQASKKYGRFLQAVNTDFTIYFRNVFDSSKNTDLHNWSQNCKPILDSIVTQYEIKELLDSYAEMDSSILIISKHKSEISGESPEFFFSNMKKVITHDMHRLNRIHRMIFDEDLGIDISEPLQSINT